MASHLSRDEDNLLSERSTASLPFVFSANVCLVRLNDA
jgi:hypothetical protein